MDNRERRPIFRINVIGAVCLIWVFINLIFLSIGWNGKQHDDFWPFGTSSYVKDNPLPSFDGSPSYRVFEINIYDQMKSQYNSTEFIVYCGGPLMIYILMRAVISKK